jgi:DNA-binding beta-propeller fold protein YncE
VGGLGGFADGQGAAARFNRPCHFGRDAAGNIYVADYYNDSIRKVTPAGLVTTLVGSPVLRGCRAGALPGSIYRPWGIAARPNGDVLVVSEAAIMAITAP